MLLVRQSPEIALLLAIIASDIWVVCFFLTYDYLPQPFIFNTFDTFMDWFNVAAFAHQGGAFDRWHAVYPPLSFVFLEWVTIPHCYTDPLFARDCDWLSRIEIVTLFFLNISLAYAVFRRSVPERALLRTCAFGLGYPMLFLLERGNLILICLPFFMLVYGGLVKTPWMRALCIGITINFKPYLVLPSLAFGIKRDWRTLEQGALATIGVYLLSLAMFGSGTPWEVLENMGIWVRATSGQVWEQIYFATTFVPFLEIERVPIPILTVMSSRMLETMLFWFPIAVRLTQAMALLGLVAAWLQPSALSTARVAALLVGFHLVSQSPGGYALTFLFFLILMDGSQRPAKIIAVIACYLVSITADWTLSKLTGVPSYSWLAERPVTISFGISVGQLARPALVLLIVWCLSIDALTRVIRAHHSHRPSLGLMPA